MSACINVKETSISHLTPLLSCYPVGFTNVSSLEFEC